MDSDSLLPPKFSIDIAIQGGDWDQKAYANEDWAAAQLAPVLGIEGVKKGELSIALTNDLQMTELNARYRGKDGPTNVLSFPAEGALLGDIVLSYETLAREAAEKGVSFTAHMSHLLIHGFLHLQGYDHQTDTDASAMEALEITALSKLGIDNPYEKQKMS